MLRWNLLLAAVAVLIFAASAAHADQENDAVRVVEKLGGTAVQVTSSVKRASRVGWSAC